MTTAQRIPVRVLAIVAPTDTAQSRSLPCVYVCVCACACMHACLYVTGYSLLANQTVVPDEWLSKLVPAAARARACIGL